MAVHITQPGTPYDRENIYRFLYGIWSDEFSRTMEGMDHRRRWMKDSLDDSAHYFCAITSSDQTLGCVRINSVQTSPLSEDLRARLKTPELTDLFGNRDISYLSHFAVSPEARGRTVASLLIGAVYRRCLEQGVPVAISYCAPPLVAFYYQLGYRPYTKNFSTDAGIRIPIIHCVRDRRYLRDIQSPMARLCSHELDDGGEAARKMMERFPAFRKPGFSRTEVHRLWARLAHEIPADASDRAPPLFEGLSPEELRLVERHAWEITFSQGEYICRRGETEQWMGVLVSGSVGVEIFMDGVARISSVISPGEPFGLIGSLGHGQRAASLVAIEDSQALLFPADFPERICRADSALGFKFAKRLLKTLAVRFSDLTEATARGSTTSSGYTPTKHDSPAPQVAGEIESYRFKSLGDRDEELKRLIKQATIGEAMEFAALNRVGLRDGIRILDLGSGPGFTTLLMARHLPSATIIGVEPEDLLRSEAEALIENQGFGGRCRFLKGTGSHIPLADGYVDFAYARLLFQHLPRPLEVLEEMRRVTRRGGIIVVLDVDDRTNIVHPPPEGLEEMETRIAEAQAACGGDRHIGRKLHGYLHETGLEHIAVEAVPITAEALGREAFFSIVYGFKRQVLNRVDGLDESASAFFHALENLIRKPTTFAMTTVFMAHGRVP
jgi:ubiquinone/menaquinone biosynthesis C-methylase UbiE/CRP-like cAMP-binding protein/GNAT superfamily N-acetyltransferase